MPSNPDLILAHALQRAEHGEPFVADASICKNVDLIARAPTNRAVVRLLMACLLAKLDNPDVDVRKPYTAIEGSDTFSGRAYDERYLTMFIQEHELPCNTTTAFLTPALRNRNQALVIGLQLEGQPPHVYNAGLALLDDVHRARVAPDDLLAEILRHLLELRDQRKANLLRKIQDLNAGAGAIPLSSEDIVSLIDSHMLIGGASRLPVLLIAAAYKTAEHHLGECIRNLQAHNAADLQTGSLGDVEITLEGDDRVVTCYEMKNQKVTKADLLQAVQKLANGNTRVDNYLFITTHAISDDVRDLARDLYQETQGVEFVVLDCIGFVRHYLHLFHRLRQDFLATYQKMLLQEPDSAVKHQVKESFLSMRECMEADRET